MFCNIVSNIFYEWEITWLWHIYSSLDFFFLVRSCWSESVFPLTGSQYKVHVKEVQWADVLSCTLCSDAYFNQKQNISSSDNASDLQNLLYVPHYREGQCFDLIPLTLSKVCTWKWHVYLSSPLSHKLIHTWAGHCAVSEEYELQEPKWRLLVFSFCVF